MARERETADDVLLMEFLLSDDPCLFTKEIANAVNMSRQGVTSRLEELESNGYLNSKMQRDRVYWLTETGRGRARESLKESG